MGNSHFFCRSSTINLNMKISEIYSSISGEGQQQGEPTVFIRTIGCNQRCKYCDSKYTYEGGEEMSVEEIIEKVKSFGYKKICLTGGEPMIQPQAYELIDKLLLEDFEIYIETNGTVFLRDEPLTANLHYVLDYKLLSSGVKTPFISDNLNNPNIYELKFVIANREDYDLAKVVLNFIPTDKQYKILFSPCWENRVKQKLVEWILEDKLNVRYSLQIHKCVWHKAKRGV